MAIIGDLSVVQPDSLWGFAFDDRLAEPVEVVLLLNGKQIARLLANEFREDVKARGLHPTGNCGFSFPLVEKGFFLPEKARIEVKIGRRKNRINHSPYLYKAKGDMAKADHLLIAGLAKSGTTILTHQIASGRPQSYICFEPGGVEGLADVALHRWYARHYPQLVTKCIFSPDITHKLGEIERIYRKKIWILRDPRDRILSALLFGWNKKYFKYPQLKLDEKWQILKRKEAHPSEVPFHSLIGPREMTYFVHLEEQMHVLLKELSGDWYKLKYEDLMVGKSEGLENYIGHPLNREIIETKRLKRVGRSKRFDNWRRWFSEEDVRFFRPLLAPFLEAGGYDPQDWTLDPQLELPAAEGSEYVKKGLLKAFKQKQMKPPSYLLD